MANVMELEINGSVHIFKAGFAFVRKAEPMKKQKQNGVENNVGLNYLIAGLIDGDVDALLETLYLMNEGDDHRLTKLALEEYIEDYEDIDNLFTKVLDFLQTANCTKAKATKLVQKVKELQAQQEAKIARERGESSTSNA